jgi:tetratricopeptide (TPR) repeat protein
VRQLGETADAARHGEPLAQRCLEAELAWRLRREEAPELARQVLSKADPEQRVIRARANMILAEVAREEYERTKDPGRLEEQFRRLQAALLLVPQNPEVTPRARLAQAETRELLGQRDEALGEYQALLKEYPELAPQIEVAIRRLQQQTPKP